MRAAASTQTSRVETASRLSIYAMEIDAKSLVVLNIRLAARRAACARALLLRLHGFFASKCAYPSLSGTDLLGRRTGHPDSRFFSCSPQRQKKKALCCNNLFRRGRGSPTSNREAASRRATVRAPVTRSERGQPLVHTRYHHGQAPGHPLHAAGGSRRPPGRRRHGARAHRHAARRHD